jgi:hypothetical protein
LENTGVVTARVYTFLDVQVPDRPSKLHLGVCDALKVGKRDFACFQMHIRRTGGQLLEEGAEFW